MAEAGIGSREGKGPALREGPAECHSMSLPTCTDVSPPGTEIPRKCSRCPILLSTWHGIPAKACQVSLPAFYLARYSRESVPGVPSRCPPATVFPQKRSRCPILPSTWHGIPAKAFQVAPLAVHLPRFFRKSVSGISSRFPPGTESPRKCSRWHLPASHLARNSCESVPGVLFCLPPATVVHLIMGCWCFSVGHVAVFSMKRATISTPAVVEYMHLSENYDVPKKVQLRVSHVWTHLQ